MTSKVTVRTVFWCVLAYFNPQFDGTSVIMQHHIDLHAFNEFRILSEFSRLYFSKRTLLTLLPPLRAVPSPLICWVTAAVCVFGLCESPWRIFAVTDIIEVNLLLETEGEDSAELWSVSSGCTYSENCASLWHKWCVQIYERFQPHTFMAHVEVKK